MNNTIFVAATVIFESRIVEALVDQPIFAGGQLVIPIRRQSSKRCLRGSGARRTCLDTAPAVIPGLALHQQQANRHREVVSPFGKSLHRGFETGLGTDHVVHDNQMGLFGTPVPPMVYESAQVFVLEEALLPVATGLHDQLVGEPAFSLTAGTGQLHPAEAGPRVSKLPKDVLLVLAAQDLQTAAGEMIIPGGPPWPGEARTEWRFLVGDSSPQLWRRFDLFVRLLGIHVIVRLEGRPSKPFLVALAL